jgi:hypothetical protein
MADSAAVRARRRRAHSRGDHSLCTARCPATDKKQVADRPPVSGPVEASVRDLAQALRFGERDPRAAMTVMAVRLAAAVDEGASASVARELRTILVWLAESPAVPHDLVDELRARRAHRRVTSLLDEHPSR